MATELTDMAPANGSELNTLLKKLEPEVVRWIEESVDVSSGALEHEVEHGRL